MSNFKLPDITRNGSAVYLGTRHGRESKEDCRDDCPSVGANYSETQGEEFEEMFQTKKVERSEKDERCRSIYSRACKKLGVAVFTRFKRQIGQKTINLSGESLGCRGVNAVCAALLKDQVTASLNLSGNRLERKIARCINDLLLRNGTITELNLSDNTLTGTGLQHLSRSLKSNRMLRRLNISGNSLGDADADGIVVMMQSMQEVTELCLSHNQFREEGGVLIGQAIATNGCLETLDLSWNHLRGRGAERVALGLCKNKTLVSLNVSWNGFGFEGACAMAHALKTNVTLRELDMTCNRIHPPALFELMGGLTKNKNLRMLRLGHNPITAHTTTSILCKIRDNKHMKLEELDLSGVVVHHTFDSVLQEIQEDRQFTVKYDKILQNNKLHVARKTNADDPAAIYNVDPVRILFLTKKNFRTVDLFNRIDRDRSNQISRDEVKTILREENLHLSSMAIDAIFDNLDTNKDGEIDFLEFLEGERRIKRMDAVAKEEQQQQQLQQQQRKMSRTKADFLDVGDGLPPDTGGLGGRFSQSNRPDLLRLNESTLEIESPRWRARSPSQANSRRSRSPRSRSPPSVSRQSNYPVIKE